MYKLVTIREETFPGDSIERVIPPSDIRPTWVIFLKDGKVIQTTHSVTVIEEAGK